MVRNLVIGLGEGVVGAAAQSREPVLVEDVRADLRYLVALDAVQSELAVPMRLMASSISRRTPLARIRAFNACRRQIAGSQPIGRLQASRRLSTQSQTS